MYNNIEDINKFIAFKNPFRYRSYYYDFETNLYYLNSRYYDPQTGRFINADDVSVLKEGKNILNGLNLYIYCGNNPITNTDENGYNWFSDLWEKTKEFFKKLGDVILGTIISSAIVAGGIILTVFSSGTLADLGGALISAGIGGFLGGIQNKLGGNSYWSGYLGGFISGGFAGLGAVWGSVAVFLGSLAGNILGTATTDAINGVNLKNFSYWKTLISESALSGLISLGSFKFGDASSVLNIPGFRDLYAGITVLSEFIFTYLYEKSKQFLHELVGIITRRISWSY